MPPSQNHPATGVFDGYAEYYDLLYRDKDYAREAEFVHSQLKAGSVAGPTLLELGCGTGRHAVEFSRLGYQVTGVDLSDGMVRQAKARAMALPAGQASLLKFQIGDVRTVRIPQVFDTVVSLFHVMNYQTSAADLRSAFRTASHHLQTGGLFLFDFWYGPAVLSDPPVVRVKRLESESIQATRIAEPVIHPNQNLVVVNYHIFIRNQRTQEVSEVREAHPMRYLFLPEIENHLAAENLNLIATGAWDSPKQLDNDTWYGWVLARKAASSTP
jgi:SAM-dependent methyltransferase